MNSTIRFGGYSGYSKNNKKEILKFGRVLHLKSEIRNRKLDHPKCDVQSETSDFGFEMQDSSNFKM